MPWEEGAVLGNNFLYTSHRLTLSFSPVPELSLLRLLTLNQSPSVPADAQETERLPSARGRTWAGQGPWENTAAHFPRSHHFAKFGELSWDRDLSLAVLNMQPTAQG